MMGFRRVFKQVGNLRDAKSTFIIPPHSLEQKPPAPLLKTKNKLPEILLELFHPDLHPRLYDPDEAGV
jgi:hypothetical protein